jgi:hypothetical protein
MSVGAMLPAVILGVCLVGGAGGPPFGEFNPVEPN